MSVVIRSTHLNFLNLFVLYNFGVLKKYNINSQNKKKKM